MRVLVTAGRIADYDGVDTAVLIGRAWRQAGAQVAALGLADAGPDWARAHDALEVTDENDYVLLTGQNQDAILEALAALGAGKLPKRWLPDPDMSAWELARLSVLINSRIQHGHQLVGLCRRDELMLPLTGPTGLAGRRQDLALADRLQLDRALTNWVNALHDAVASPSRETDAVTKLQADDEPATPGRRPGSGAGGGAGSVIQTFGGQVRSALDVLAGLAKLETSIACADLVVSACDDFDADTWGGPVINYVAQLAEQQETPLVVVTRTNHTNQISQRQLAIQAVHAVGDAAEMTSACSGFAASWMW